MPFDIYDDVILTRDVTERGLRAGDVGTVVERHVVPGVPEEGYSVEFFDRQHGGGGHAAGERPAPGAPPAPAHPSRSASRASPQRLRVEAQPRREVFDRRPLRHVIPA